MWVFGYGSLVWKADFPFRRKIPGYVKGYLRRFYQETPDHRGTPDKAKVWGVAYEIAPEHENVVAGHLDYRERAGYKKQNVLFYPAQDQADTESIILNNTGSFEAVAYVGLRSNPYYIEHENVEVMARRILEAKGESGSNKDYLFKLAEAMHEITPDAYDEHLDSLVAAVKELEKANSLNIY